jgi:hypothetical protein
MVNYTTGKFLTLIAICVSNGIYSAILADGNTIVPLKLGNGVQNGLINETHQTVVYRSAA